ncbi:MAG TPA: cation diffusion facilitator family transporter [Burkholderiaceae bacterium]|nr:cation diffusion facilitator family transporter [Burkholderiaceae bacterium]
MAIASKTVVYAALTGNLLIAAAKFTAAALTGSSAMLSEGVHSVVDTGNQVLLLYGMRRARQAPDDEHPFGHGKEIYFWSFVVALLIFSTGAGVSFYEGVLHLIHPAKLLDPQVAYAVLAFSAAFEGGSWLVAYRKFRPRLLEYGPVRAVEREKNPANFAVLFEDSAALAGIVVAFLGVLLGDLMGSSTFDAVASILIGVILAVTAWWLARETKGLLIGESANREIVAGIERLATSHPEIERVNEVLTMHVGPDYILAGVSLDAACDLPSGRTQALTEELDRQIKAAYPNVKRVFIESHCRTTEPHGTA